MHSVNGVKLPWDVEAQGGARFPQALENQKQDSVWASKQNVITAYQNKVDALAKKYPGVRQFGAYWTMGGTSGDFNAMTADTLLGLLKNGKLTKKAVKELDASMLSSTKGKWTGLGSDEVRGVLRNSSQMRKLLINYVDDGPRQKIEGMPDIGAVRHATMDPDLIMAPNGMTGLSISELFPGAKANRAPTVPHDSYDTHMRGKYLGELKTLLPGRVAFPDFYKAYDHLPPANRDYTFRLNWPAQLMDDKWRDGVEAWMKQRRK